MVRRTILSVSRYRALIILGSLTDSFSPYLDPEPWADFWEDFSRRNMTAIIAALMIHVLLFVMIQPAFIMPDLIEDEPEAIPVQIIAFGDLPPDTISKPIIDAPAPPVEASPALPPRVRPKPKPTPPPTQIAPPPPKPEPIPEPEPEPIPAPAPEVTTPDILANDTIAPETPSEPLPQAEPLPEPVIVEPEPVIPQPILEPEPIPEPIPKEPQASEWRPYVPPQAEPEPEPIPEPEIIEPEIIQDPPTEWRPYTPPPPDVPLEPEPAPGTLDETLPDLPDIETLPPITREPEPEPEPELIDPVIEIPQPVERDNPADLPIPNAPKILASPDAPITQQETERAIPESQSATLDPKDPIKQVPQRGAGQPSTGLSAPSGGLKTFDSSRAPSGSATGRPRTNPGASGWTLAKPGGTDTGPGYKGITLDIRCREAGRTHEDCPEYLRQYAGRNRSGFESFSSHASSGDGSSTVGNTRPATTGSRSPQSGASPWNSSTGDNSINAGGPSTTIFDDTGFMGGTQRSDDFNDTSPRVRDRFKEPDAPWEEEPILLPPPPEDE